VWKVSYGYDEPLHVDLAYVYSRAPLTFYGPGELAPTRADAELETEVPGYQIDHNWPGAAPDPVGPVRTRAERPTLDEAGGVAPAPGVRRNQMIQHPPLYYWLAAGVLRIPGVSGLAWDLQLWLMRLLSVVLALPLPILCWATARRLLELGSGRSAASPEGWAVLAALVPLSVPGLVRNVASVSNDVLLIVATSVFLYAVTRVLTGDLTLRTSLVVSVSFSDTFSDIFGGGGFASPQARFNLGVAFVRIFFSRRAALRPPPRSTGHRTVGAPSRTSSRASSFRS